MACRVLAANLGRRHVDAGGAGPAGTLQADAFHCIAGTAILVAAAFVKLNKLKLTSATQPIFVTLSCILLQACTERLLQAVIVFNVYISKSGPRKRHCPAFREAMQASEGYFTYIHLCSATKSLLFLQNCRSLADQLICIHILPLQVTVLLGIRPAASHTCPRQLHSAPPQHGQTPLVVACRPFQKQHCG